MQKENNATPFGPVIKELDNLVPKFPNTGNPKDEAIYFTYQQAKIAYYFLCSLLQGKSQAIGVYIYAWSIVDNAARYSKLTGKNIQGLTNIRNGFQHIDEKIELYKNGCIPVYGSISYWYKENGCLPEFGLFPKDIGRSFVTGTLSNTDLYHEGISHLTLSALASNGKNGTSTNQQALRLDKLVLEMGKEVCQKFGQEK